MRAVEWCPGGYNEPVEDLIPFDPDLKHTFNEVHSDFVWACVAYMRRKGIPQEDPDARAPSFETPRGYNTL